MHIEVVKPEVSKVIFMHRDVMRMYNDVILQINVSL